MFGWLKSLIQDSDTYVMIFTLATVILASFKNWFVADNNLKLTYWLMIFLGVAYIGLNTSVAMQGESQQIVYLMNLPAFWTSLMGIKGLRRLKQNEAEKSVDNS